MAQAEKISPLQWVNIGLRGLMEALIVFGFGYWGYHTGGKTLWKILLAAGAPLAGFGFWGLVDFHQFGPKAEVLRLVQELAISGLAALALYSAGAHRWGWGLGILSAIQHALTYLLGDRLLKD